MPSQGRVPDWAFPNIREGGERTWNGEGDEEGNGCCKSGRALAESLPAHASLQRKIGSGREKSREVESRRRDGDVRVDRGREVEIGLRGGGNEREREREGDGGKVGKNRESE